MLRASPRARINVALPLLLVLALAGCDRDPATGPTPVVPTVHADLLSPAKASPAVTSGSHHTCALTPAGAVDCWGSNLLGQAADQAGPYVQVSAGVFHTCALTPAGAVDCWGENGFGQAADQAGPYIQVSAGGRHTCALTPAGAADCWGDAADQAGPYVQVSATHSHTCALTPAGAVDCWGDNESGQADDQAGPYVEVSARSLHTCALTPSGAVDCWGLNDSGQAADQAGPYVQMSTGNFHTCALTPAGAVDCWGSNGSPQAEDRAGPYVHVSAGGTHTCVLTPTREVHCWGSTADGPAQSQPGPAGSLTIDAGAVHTCVLTPTGTADCWGLNNFGQAADQTGPYVQVSAGTLHNCALTPARAADCWGDNTFGQATDQPGPYVHVSAGLNHTCGLTPAGAVDCWGANNLGQATDQPGPYVQLSVGDGHNCALTPAGAADCWGRNDFGAASDQPGPYVQVSARSLHTCGIRPSGAVDCWGANNFGQAADQAGPYVQVSTADFYTCALTAVGAIDCWGRNDVGEASDRPGPYVQVSGGVDHTCALTPAGKVACWGSNAVGQTSVPPALAVTVATTTTVSATPGSQQYSDKVTLSAAVSPTTANGSTVTGTVQFTIDGANVGAPVHVASDGTASLENVAVALGHGSYTVTAVFTSTNADFATSTSGGATLTVTREDAAVLYAGANPAALQVAAPGGALAANALVLSLGVEETEPDVATTTAAAGNVENAGLTVTLVPVGPGSSYALTCTAAAVTGSGYAAARPFTCTNPVAITVNAYEVRAEAAGNFYAGGHTDAFTVFDPSLGFAAGGGSFTIGGEKVNFGFTMKYTKKGTNTQGGFIAVRHHADGTVSRLKSNALEALAIGEDETVPMGWASFSGKATYTTWDASAGEYVTAGGQDFAVFAEDRNNPGDGTDRIWLGGPAALALPGTLGTAAANAVPLAGGNIGVPHKAAGGGGKK